MLHFPLVLVNRLNKTESAVLKYCRFSLFLKFPFFRLFAPSNLNLKPKKLSQNMVSNITQYLCMHVYIVTFRTCNKYERFISGSILLR